LANWDFDFEIKGVPDNDEQQAGIVAELLDPSVGAVVSDKLVFRIKPYDTNVGTDEGAGIEHVDMYVIDPNGNEVNYEHESATKFCGFGGGDPDCNEYVFADNDNKWKNGQDIQNGTHTLRSVVFADSGEVRQFEWQIQIQLD
jgi:hypothetical protein